MMSKSYNNVKHGSEVPHHMIHPINQQLYNRLWPQLQYPTALTCMYLSHLAQQYAVCICTTKNSHIRFS